MTNNDLNKPLPMPHPGGQHYPTPLEACVHGEPPTLCPMCCCVTVPAGLMEEEEK